MTMNRGPAHNHRKITQSWTAAFDAVWNPPQYSYQLHTASRSLNPWRQELELTTKHIYDTAKEQNSTLMICHSGGIDGEVAARSLLDQNITDFTIVTFDYISRDGINLNKHDTVYADDFCKKFNLTQIKIPIVPGDVLHIHAPNLANQGYYAANLVRYMQIRYMQLIDELNGTALVCGGEQLFTQHPNIADKPVVKYKPDYMTSIFWAEDHYANTGKKHFPYLFFQNVELYLAYRNIDLIKTYLTSKDQYFKIDYGNRSLEKILVYHSIWPDMQLRPKFDGYENITTPPTTNLMIDHLNLNQDLILQE